MAKPRGSHKPDLDDVLPGIRVRRRGRRGSHQRLRQVDDPDPIVELCYVQASRAVQRDAIRPEEGRFGPWPIGMTRRTVSGQGVDHALGRDDPNPPS